MARRLKYFSMKPLMVGPNFHIRKATRKNPTVNMTQKFHSTNNALTLWNRLTENAGIVLKKKMAKPVNSPPAVIHAKCPMAYPANAPDTEPTGQFKAKRKALPELPKPTQ